jgi:hypothetical protein
MEELGARVESLSEGAAVADVALRSIFIVNNELGRLARQDSSLRGALTQLQLRLNLVTIEVKRGRPTEARDAFRQAEKAFGLVAEDISARKFEKEFISRAGRETH